MLVLSCRLIDVISVGSAISAVNILVVKACKASCTMRVLGAKLPVAGSAATVTMSPVWFYRYRCGLRQVTEVYQVLEGKLLPPLLKPVPWATWHPNLNGFNVLSSPDCCHQSSRPPLGIRCIQWLIPVVPTQHQPTFARWIQEKWTSRAEVLKTDTKSPLQNQTDFFWNWLFFFPVLFWIPKKINSNTCESFGSFRDFHTLWEAQNTKQSNRITYWWWLRFHWVLLQCQTWQLER